MPGWGKLVVGAIIGVAGTVYATNEDVRRRLPQGARDLPDALKRRFETAVAAGREASSNRRAEILRALEEHEAEERSRAAATRVEDVTAPPVVAPAGEDPVEPVPVDDDATRPLGRVEEKP